MRRLAMAIYRTVSLSFWTDSKVTDDFTPEDKYFYLYLFTNPHTNLAGCYEISVRQMAYETGYIKETIERLIDRFKNVHKNPSTDPLYLPRKSRLIKLYTISRYSYISRHSP